MTQKELRKYFDYLPDGTFRRRLGYQCCQKGQIVRGSPERGGYRIICFRGERTTFSRAVWIWHYGKIIHQIDHINRKRDDNRIENLQDISQAKNCQRQRRTRDSNVYWVPEDKLWKVMVCAYGKKISKYFKTKSAARTGAKKLRLELHGL